MDKGDARAGADRASEREESAPTTAPTPLGNLLQFSRRHLTVIAAILAVGVLVAGYALTRARAIPVAPVPVAVSPTPVLESEAASPSPSVPLLRVHVVGAVPDPGVHSLPEGSRVIDAIDAAGGLTEAARPGELNLAQVLQDGQQVAVGGAGDPPSEVRGGAGGTGDSGSAAGGKINLNTATTAQLDTLPGVGPVTAEKILAWRTEHKKFTRIEELQEVPGIGPKSYAEIAPHVTV